MSYLQIDNCNKWLGTDLQLKIRYERINKPIVYRTRVDFGEFLQYSSSAAMFACSIRSVKLNSFGEKKVLLSLCACSVALEHIFNFSL